MALQTFDGLILLSVMWMIIKLIWPVFVAMIFIIIFQIWAQKKLNEKELKRKIEAEKRQARFIADEIEKRSRKRKKRKK